MANVRRIDILGRSKLLDDEKTPASRSLCQRNGRAITLIMALIEDLRRIALSPR